MRYLLALVALAGLIGAAVRWVYGRRELDLSFALDAPWWLWPLMRLDIHLRKRQAHPELYELCGWIDAKREASKRPGQYIAIKQGDDGRYQVEIKVKPGFPQGDDDEDARQSRKMQVVNHARGSLALGPVDFDWLDRRLWPPRWRGRVVITPKKLIPTEAKYHEDAEVRAAFHLATKDVIVPAIGKGDQPVKHSLVSDDPHGFISGATKGGCKTSTLRVIAVQQYLAGAEILICDGIKQFSHTRWAIDPETEQPWPRITYADTIEECAHQIVRAQALMEARNARTKQVTRRGGRAPVFPRLVILLDDANHLETEFKRNGYQGARDALAALLLAGREVFINLFAAFQDATALAAGSTTNRAQYGLRMICEYGGSSRTNNKVAPQVQLPPCIPSGVQPGWCVIVHGALSFEAQRIFLREEDARRLVAEATTQRTEGLALRGRQQQLRSEHHVEGNGADGERCYQPGAAVQPVDSSVDFDGDGLGPGHDSIQHHSRSDVNPFSVAGELGSPGPQRRLDKGSGRDISAPGRRPPLSPLEPGPRPSVGFSLPPRDLPSMQAIEAVSRIDGIDINGNDGGIEYLPLRDIAAQEWCPWTYETVRKYARDEPSFPPPIEGFDNPRRWSASAVELWIEERQADTGQPGVYVIGLDTETTVKIGETKNLGGRLDQLALGGLPRADVVQHWFPCPTKKVAQELEDWFRGKYRHQRVGDSEFHRKEGRLLEDLGNDARMLAGCPKDLLGKVRAMREVTA